MKETILEKYTNCIKVKQFQKEKK